MPVMCQMCHVPLMFAMTKHMHHIWGGSFVETVDLKKLEDAVLSDLETIKEYIANTFRDIYRTTKCKSYDSDIADSDFAYLFGGVMSLDDFANFIYFSYLSDKYMDSEPKTSLYRQFLNFQNLNSEDPKAKKNARLSNEEFKRFTGSWPLGESSSDSRGAYNTLKTMLGLKNIPENDCIGAELWTPIRTLAQYDSNSTIAKRQGMRIGKSVFYQLATWIKLRTLNKNVLRWMASDGKRTVHYEKFYLELLCFLKMWMLDDHSIEELLSNKTMEEIRMQLKPEDLKEDKTGVKEGVQEACMREYDKAIAECEDRKETYIARAINLEIFERRCRFLLILDFALALGEKNDYFTLSCNKQRYQLSNLPPHFFIQVAPNNLAVNCPSHRIKRIFGQLSACFDNNPNKAFAVPTLMFDRYTRFFLDSVSDKERATEEYRYYSIVYLTCIILFGIGEEIRLSYDHNKFIWFIENKYNIFKLYEGKVNRNVSNVITAPIANNLRKIVKEMVGEQ